jgi:hypothetical protein
MVKNKRMRGDKITSQKECPRQNKLTMLEDERACSTID